MTDPKNKPFSHSFSFLEQLGISRLDILAENTEPVLAAKMTVAGFIDQAAHFLGALKNSIMASPNGLDLNTTRIFLESSKQAIEYALNAVDKYEKIRQTSRDLTKLKLANAANDNDIPDEVTEFVYNHPSQDAEREEVTLAPQEEEAPPPPRKPTDKKLN
jgi:hypothetical protein